MTAKSGKTVEMPQQVKPLEVARGNAQELIEEFGTFYAAAKALGDRNLRSGLWALQNQDRPPSPRLSDALETWANVKPVIIEAAPGTVIFGEVGLLDLGQVASILILEYTEIDEDCLVKCQVCGRKTIKRAGNQKFCSRHSYATPEGRRWHRQHKKGEHDEEEKL